MTVIRQCQSWIDLQACDKVSLSPSIRPPSAARSLGCESSTQARISNRATWGEVFGGDGVVGTIMTSVMTFTFPIDETFLISFPASRHVLSLDVKVSTEPGRFFSPDLPPVFVEACPSIVALRHL